MQKILLVISMLIIVSFVFITLSHATTVDELLKNPNLDAQTRERIVQTLKKDNQFNVDRVTEWGQIGEAFALTIEKICKTLSLEANEFIKTPVGKLVAVVILYKVMGPQFLSIIILSSLIFTITLVFIFFIWFLYGNRKIKEKDKPVRYESRYDWNNHDSDTKIIVLILSIVIYLLIVIISFSSMI